MTHFTDALSGIVRHFYIDLARFPDRPMRMGTAWLDLHRNVVCSIHFTVTLKILHVVHHT